MTDRRSLSVLHVTPSLSAHYGGPTVAVRGLTRALTDQGFRCTVATLVAPDDTPENIRRNEALQGFGIRLKQFESHIFSPVRFAYSCDLRRWLGRALDDFDLVHVHGVFAYPGLAAARLAARRGTPFIVSPHGMLDDWSLQQKSWKKRPYLRLIEAKSLRSAAGIHVTTRLEEEAVRKRGFGSQIKLIPLGVDRPEPSGRRQYRTGTFRILFVSRLHEKKGLPTLFRAVHRLDQEGVDVELLVAGAGEPQYEAELKELTERLGIARLARFLGWVDGPEKDALFQSSDVFVLASHTENFGVAAAEALAAGLPVILSSHVGIAAEVAGASAGLIVDRDPDDLARALWSLACDRVRRARMGERAARLASERFSWGSAARGMAAFYESAVSTATRPR